MSEILEYVKGKKEKRLWNLKFSHYSKRAKELIAK
jgi:hypothetical protein